MARIIIDGKPVECRDGMNVLQAALEAGFDIPHYCYHPCLTVVASCRLCLMEMKVLDPATGGMEWSPKLVPSCQTTVSDGMEVRFDSPAVKSNQARTMELYLVNHPLDCPVCDKAGECYLQDYSYRFGNARSRAVDPKHENPKKDIGPHTVLYQDRCVMCTRCVRFAREVAGTSELCVVDRGHRAEIDVFPGSPLANPIQGNVVDLCPVGALADKDFQFRQRVWFMRSHDSVCRGCATGCAIHVDENDGFVHRLRPRWNPGVNDWWMCDEGRFGWHFVHDAGRIRLPRVRRGMRFEPLTWESLANVVRQRIEQVIAEHGPASLAVQLSPEMSNEEAWLLATFVRSLAPEAALALGDVQTVGQDQQFPLGEHGGKEKFIKRAEAHPNCRGVQAVLLGLSGSVISREDMPARAAKGEYKALWIVGGYPKAGWASKELTAAVSRAELLIVQDIFESPLTAAAHVVLPFAAWVEREGSFVNAQGLVQPFERAILPTGGAVQDGQYLWSIGGHADVFRAARVREMMVKVMPQFGDLYVPPLSPKHQH